MAVSLKCSGLSQVEELSVQTIRFLSMDSVQAAKSGHPGMPMGMAAAAYTLWQRHMKFSPANPSWINRDRFVLSAGHGCALLYSLLYLFGYDMTIEDIRNFRQWGSSAAGHPEYGHPAGIEVTTGPLGQGIANAVGMAIAQKYLAAYFNRDGFNLFDYRIYVVSGDGCLQEGISSEACSLAGHLALDNIIIIYDDNHITIDGNTDIAFTEDVVRRYEAYGWNVIVVTGDGSDMNAFDAAINKAKAQNQKPTLIKFRSHIAFGSPNFQDSHSAHGAPLGQEEIKLIKKNYGWDPEKTFHVPQEVLDSTRKAVERGRKLEGAYNKMLAEYGKAYPELAGRLKDWFSGKLGVDIEGLLPKFDAGTGVATRKASGDVLDSVMPGLDMVLGGSADLTPSNNTHFKGVQDFQKTSRTGRYIRYGVREHAMGAIMNGIAVSALIPYGGTFLVFSDYMRPAIRIAALAHYPTIFVFTHDSIGVGQDGPTHQPVEHLASLRAIPNLLVFRPADANETVQMWKFILQYRKGPVVMALTRQNLTVLDQKKYGSACALSRGAYVLIPQEKPDCLLLATGSEIGLAVRAHGELAAENIRAQVVSMPCWELFEKQDKAYMDSVLPPRVRARVGIEAGIRMGWDKWLGDNGLFVGMSSFGASAPAQVCFEKFGITVPKVVEAAVESIAKSR